MKMKIFLMLAVCGLFSVFPSQAQQAQRPVRYQAVLRDGQGYVRADAELELRLRLSSLDGEVLYEELHRAETDALGQVEVLLGTGSPVEGRYDAVDWSEDLLLRAYEGGRELASLPVTAVPSALHASRASVAGTLEGKRFSDTAAPSLSNYYSSEKVAKMIQGQTGQTGLARETAERKAEDLRILDSLKAEAGRRLQSDLALLDSIAAMASANEEDYGHLLDSLRALASRIGEVDLEREREDLRIWDSLAQLDRELAAKEQNVCEASDPARGVYADAIPLYSLDNPDTIGLFAMPELKVLRQSGPCALFSDVALGTNLDRSFKTRVLAYNTTGNPLSPQTLTIPAGTSGIEVYVDNYRIDAPVEYTTYDILVFDVEYYHIDAGQGKLYVTLVRE